MGRRKTGWLKHRCAVAGAFDYFLDSQADADLDSGGLVAAFKSVLLLLMYSFLNRVRSTSFRIGKSVLYTVAFLVLSAEGLFRSERGGKRKLALSWNVPT